MRIERVHITLSEKICLWMTCSHQKKDTHPFALKPTYGQEELPWILYTEMDCE